MIKIKDAYIYSYNDFLNPLKIKSLKAWGIIPDPENHRNWYGVTLNGYLKNDRFVEINISLDTLYKLVEAAERLKDERHDR